MTWQLMDERVAMDIKPLASAMAMGMCVLAMHILDRFTLNLFFVQSLGESAS